MKTKDKVLSRLCVLSIFLVSTSYAMHWEWDPNSDWPAIWYNAYDYGSTIKNRKSPECARPVRGKQTKDNALAEKKNSKVERKERNI